jgi:nitroreductase
MVHDAAGFFEVLESTRAMRRLKPDQVPDALIQRILEAGVCAANASNSQQWRFLVVKDEWIKRDVQILYQRAFDQFVAPHYLSGDPPPGVTRERYMRQYAAVAYLTEHFHEAPVWIVPCLEHGAAEPTRAAGASIYPAVQNMLLAARALGLGATLTTRHLMYEQECEAALGLPHGVHSYAIVPIGLPMGRFGPVVRRPLKEVVYSDRWGNPYSTITGDGNATS